MIDLPQPETTPESQPYWDNLRQSRLVIQQCSECGRFRHYPRPVCAVCTSMECVWTEAAGSGRLHSWTVCHHAFHKAVHSETPYILGIIELPEGVRMLTRIRDLDPGDLRIGLPLGVRFRAVNEDVVLPEFGMV